MRLPEDFIWGVAASSYQIEGAVAEDGRLPSIWDIYCRDGRVKNKGSGEHACDHYHRYVEDVAIMREIGVTAYRLSTSWSRVIPAGFGAVNPKGLGFYDRLVDELLAGGIEPFVTLFHWDLPQELYLQGGWLNPAIPDWFAEYTRVVVERLSDRVRQWITLNEPQCFIGLGMERGDHAPGLKMARADVLTAYHHALLAHGKAVQTIRAVAQLPPIISVAPTGNIICPATDSPADLEAAYQETFSIREANVGSITWASDPLFLGHYPEDGLRLMGKDMPRFSDSDMATICQPLDYLGANIYYGWKVTADADGARLLERDQGYDRTAIHWPVLPEICYYGPKFYQRRYGLPVVITENGMAGLDWVALDNRVHDPQRIDFHARTLGWIKKAIADGIDIRGYFIWSIMDNFEWQEGYEQRFGLVHVDYKTGKRRLKDSAFWYRDTIKAHGDTLQMPI